MKTTASILVRGVKQRFYFTDTVFLEDNTEFEIEFFNKSKKTAGAILTINGERLSRYPVIYNGQKYILKDFINDARKFLFKVYEVDSNDVDVKQAIEDNGVITIEYYYERPIEQKIIKQIQSESSPKRDSNVNYSIESIDDIDAVNYSLADESDFSHPETSDLHSKEETGKITKGSLSSANYKSVNIELDFTVLETQKIQILPFSRKPKFIKCSQCQYISNIEANYCEECGNKY